MKKMTETERMKRVKELCLKEKAEVGEVDWLGLDKRPITRKGANMFVLGAIIDYQIPADKAWERAEWMAMKHFKGTEDIWKEILKYTPSEWTSFCKANSVHRFPKAYERIQRIGKVIEEVYHGDARNIWRDVSNEEVRKRLNDMSFGRQIGNMVMGALFDSGELTGILDLKADTNVMRVLGRVIKGHEVGTNDAIELARGIYPENPWELDFTLYFTGKDYCFKHDPDCDACPFSTICVFNS